MPQFTALLNDQEKTRGLCHLWFDDSYVDREELRHAMRAHVPGIDGEAARHFASHCLFPVGRRLSSERHSSTDPSIGTIEWTLRSKRPPSASP